MAKKIGAAVSLSIIGILIIVTIILANIKINYSIKCENPTDIWISYSNKGYQKAKSDEHYNSIVNFINNASKENTLSAMLNGNLSKKAEITEVSTNKKLPSTTGFYVEYSYSAPQKLMEGNKEYNNATYSRLVFTVENANESKDVSVYVFTNNSTEYYSYYYTLDANFYDLYNYLVECGYNQ